MNSVYPTTGFESEWKAAHDRLEAYVMALCLTNQEQRERIISTVLRQAALKHAQNPGESPMVLAMNEIHELLDQWFAKIIPSRERVSVTGLISLFAIDATKRWPGAFLADEVPADFQRTLRACEVNAAPGLSVSRMVPQPFETALSDINLPTALGQLTKDLPPSLVTKVIAFVLSGFTIWSGNRLR